MNPELKYDVVVAGAGVAGIAAAVAAARRGMKTALIEKQRFTAYPLTDQTFISGEDFRREKSQCP